MNAKIANLKELFFGFGILIQGKLKQPVDGLGAGLKTLGKPELIKLLHQLLFQAQMDEL